MHVALRLAPVLLLAPAVSLDELVPHPEAGATRVLTGDRRLEIELTGHDVELVVDGEKQDVSAPDIELSIVETRHIVLTDEILAAEGPRATKLSRTFDELASSSTRKLIDPQGEEHDNEATGESELEGHAVVFTWNADDEDYTVAWAKDEEGDDELLEPLQADLGFEQFLPSGDVDEGDEWDVPVCAWSLVRRPGGDLAIEIAEEENGPEYGTQYDDNLEGKITATYAGTEEVDGVRLARIDFTAELRTWMEEERDIDIPNADSTLKRSARISSELEGKLLWDVGAGRAHAFEAGGDTTAEVTTVQEISGTFEGFSEMQRSEKLVFEGRETFQVALE